MKGLANNQFLSRGLLVVGGIQLLCLLGIFLTADQQHMAEAAGDKLVMLCPLVLVMAGISMMTKMHPETRRRGKWLLAWSFSGLLSLILASQNAFGADGDMLLPILLNMVMIGAAVWASGSIRG